MVPWVSSWRSGHHTKSLLFCSSLAFFVLVGFLQLYISSFFSTDTSICMDRSCRTQSEVRGSSKLVYIPKDNWSWYGSRWFVTREAGANEEVSDCRERMGRKGGRWFLYACLPTEGKGWEEQEPAQRMCQSFTEMIQEIRRGQQSCCREEIPWLISDHAASASKTELWVLPSSCSCPKDFHIQHNLLFLLILKQSPCSSQGLLLCPFPGLPSLTQFKFPIFRPV